MTYQKSPPPERVIIQAKPHWARLFWPAALTGLGLFCSLCTIVGATAEPSPGQRPPPDEMFQCMAFCTAFIFLLAMVWVIRETKGYIESDFTLTNRRIILEDGGFRRRSLDMYLRRIDSLYVERSILGRMMGYGTINIRGGSDRPWRVKITDAEKIRNHIQEQIARQ